MQWTLAFRNGISVPIVKHYVKSNKNDARDAEAICEAVTRPNMRFVPVKNAEQQAVLSTHRAREGFVRARTAQGNQMRGLVGELRHRHPERYRQRIPPGLWHCVQAQVLSPNASSYISPPSSQSRAKAS